MANLVRFRASWSGAGLVGPGVSTFYFEESGSGFPADVKAFFEAVKAYIPNAVTITYPTDGDLIDVATGAISGTWTDAAATPTNGTAAGSYAQGVGARIAWRTSGIRAGRRVRGSTFLAPLTTANLSTNGLWLPGVATGILTAANALVTDTSQQLMIYSKPGPAGAGQASPVTSASVTETISWLRSRRV